MSVFGFLVVFGFVAFAFWNAAVNPKRALLTTVFLIPWGALYADFGLWVNAYQISLLALIIMTVLRSLYSDWRPRAFFGTGIVLCFLLYAILTSLLQIAFIPQIAINLNDGVLRGPTGRAMVQMFMFCFIVSPAILFPLLITSREQVVKIFRIYVISALVLAVIGWWQMIIWYGTGTNPIPINSFNLWLGGHTETSQGMFNFGDLLVFRMNSMSGEPRSLGAVFIFAMMMIQGVAATTPGLPRGKLFGIWLFLAVSTVATLSTSALALWTICSLLQFPTALLFGVKLRISLGKILGLMLAIIAPFLIMIAAVEASGFPLLDILSARTIERIDSNGSIEDFDLAIIDFLKDHPERAIAGVGVGNAHLYAMRYVDPEYQWYALGRVFTAKTQYLRFISEIGLIGLGIFLSWMLVLLLRAAAVVRDPRFAGIVAIIPITTMAVIMSMVNGGIMGEVYTIAGVMGAVGSMVPLRRRQNIGAPQPA